MPIVFYYIIPAIMVITILYCCFFTDILKDISTSKNPNKPYSYSRTQLMWWTFLILPTISICYAANGFNFPVIDPSLLSLLGIGVGTRIMASIIDGSDIQNGKDRVKADRNSINFITDILDDGHGISIHRLQGLLFNVLFGIIYLNTFSLCLKTLPSFSAQELALIGISSGSYLALKANENSKPMPKQDS
ncbi:MAG: hypothetical protein IKD55_05250 [Sediminibacterium sp.]|nr:hypothetical protein [Sediminibacterium sp.]MBX9780011.1 hypothetical protein [Chitinophagaceae bacterium]